MKFLCDRCKTRYSIGDDRVRGKILKIRCKNCANVITVREGMLDADAAEAALAPDQRRHKQPTTVAPTVQAEAPAPVAANGALGAAFASAMSKPPPALEEEWYVSIDGEQAGPFSLAEAQRWVAGKHGDADLHCWSEGFDDWLPVDKVSHFRGLRKKPAPPPLPRASAGAVRPAIGGRAGAPAQAPAIEDEPKPLFAATMASLESSPAPASAAVDARGHLTGLPAIVAQSPSAGAPGPSALELRPAANNGRPSPGPASPAQPTPGRANGSAKAGAARGAGAKGLRSAFDVSDPGDSRTEIEAPPFTDEHATSAEPVASARRQAQTGNDAFAKAMADVADAAATVPRLSQASAPERPRPPSADEDVDGDGDLDIGEVSRVVNLADIARSGPRGDRAQPARRSGPLALNQTGSMNRMSAPRLGGGTAPAAAIAGSADGLGPGDAPGLAPELVPPLAAVSHRRGMIALVVGATLLLGAAIAVVFLVTSGDDASSSRLGHVDDIDTSRPDDLVRRGSDGTPTVEPLPNPFVPRPKWTAPRPPVMRPEPPVSGGNSLKADEIEDMAGKYAATTQRCYMRSQRGVDAILIGNVKKIYVTLTIAGDGSVSDVQLSENHAANTLGKCLMGSIRGWRFRTSPGGTFKFVLAFG